MFVGTCILVLSMIETTFFALSCVAMLQLKAINKPYCAKETRFVKTACLPNQPFDSGTECVISGWGVTETREYHLNLNFHRQPAGQLL